MKQWNTGVVVAWRSRYIGGGGGGDGSGGGDDGGGGGGGVKVQRQGIGLL